MGWFWNIWHTTIFQLPLTNIPQLLSFWRLVVPTGFLTSVGIFLANRDQHVTYLTINLENRHQDHHTLCLPLSCLPVMGKLKKGLRRQLMIYRQNLSPKLLLLHGNSMYHVEGCNIGSRETHPRLSPKDKTKNVWSSREGNLSVPWPSWFERT